MYSAGYDEVHDDEKWFFLTEKQWKIYLAIGELPPQREVKNKNHIIKVMFLCTVARPRFDSNGNCTFDGKIGMWPFIKRVTAERTSCNRPAGAVETKAITSVTKPVFRNMMLTKVIPAIVAKWPRSRSREPPTVYIQQDNCRVHFDEADEQWMEVSTKTKTIKLLLKDQLPMSPDCNKLDLCLFGSLQSLQFQQKPATNIDELVANYQAAFNQYDPVKLNRAWLTGMGCMEQILLELSKEATTIPFPT